MKEICWNDCIINNSSISIKLDTSKVRSLIDTVKGRNLFLNKNSITEEDVNYIFEGYYSSVLELLHAILLLDGFKVNNHICVGFYVRDVMEEQKMFRIFDDCRYKRNSLIYYGKKLKFEVAKNAVEKCKWLIKELEVIIKEKIN
ncbi:hypothetical protein HN695_08075 [Candidatus Woesearchaeota archaeon]|jgi:hypothetical protein|nr:hypothetical protein [Candidatus Woesearchaeota archaeon]MBT5272498.1 hypothetical protein [Candidatus Woesearchaeota archaeon]MBT6041494.1 hypothetical protein [Candidatus Woesearchaeota archaeon]MBT6336360.1 hypothetical protein [Candidatus Woesearchaeota archaeon]MBT7928262.1 hypothetical protein [Candidatus Woesearchaeota archaeon]